MDGTIHELRSLVQAHPVVDNHAHNLLSAQKALDYEKYPLELITSEAEGEALKQTSRTLSHTLAVKQLATLYNCEPTWAAIKAAREKWISTDYKGLVRKCLEGTETLLLDDLIVDSDIENYKWHNQFIGSASGTRRIVRIEAIAAKVLYDFWGPEYKLSREQMSQSVQLEDLETFLSEFQERMHKHIIDPNVAGFKSVVCYRTGLDIQMQKPNTDSVTACQEALRKLVMNGPPFRIAEKPINDILVRMSLTAIRDESGPERKPMQFHTGLGDNDINLVLANPAYLQPLIEDYKEVNFVLLHSSYPYTREAGYLASVYPNVFVDLGEVYSIVSKDAEDSILRQSMELTPTSRLLWSTDGHFHPETYWLSNKQFRDTLETVLVDYVEKGVFTISQARDATVDILFENSNKLYALGLPPPKYELKKLDNKNNTNDVSNNKRIEDLYALAASNPNMTVWMQWVDYTATTRVRMFPIREFIKVINGQRQIGITLAALHMLQDDSLAPGGLPTGQFCMKPDLSSFYENAALESNSATVMTFWEDEKGQQLEGCPRTTLHRIVTALHPIEVTLGFEIEVIFLRRDRGDNDDDDYVWEPLTKNHSWSNMTSDIRRHALRLIEEIVTTLASINIHVEQFHAESAPGQFEFVLPPDQPLQAIDTLLKARQTIQNVAEKHDIRATLFPRPYPYAAGTASHAHFSISPATEEEHFLAGVLAHFSSITAFSLSQDVSYERVVSGVWAGSEWITWGMHNKEAPIRKIESGHWELKSLDGLANMYLAMAALLTAGYLGITHSMPLTHKDCGVDASTLSPEERQELGITDRIPRRLEESLGALEDDEDLCAVLGSGFIKKYLAVKRAEAKKLKAMDERERRLWLIERY